MENNHDEVFGHKPGLFLLFFTEMWERFSYYGMRALLTLFLVSEIAGGGWGWSREDALRLYAWYTGLVYFTPILGGIAADKILGYRGAVLLGALLMTLGHASMALESSLTFYTGLGLLILGNGFFKPNISTIVGQLYADETEKKDGAYTIFYMGINAGAFLGILLCGYIGEKVGWSYGFGLAGVFMFLGMIMFQFGQSIFGEVGKLHSAAKKLAADAAAGVEETPTNVVWDRLVVIIILSISTIFFWMAFEQAGGSMTIFAKDYTKRVLSGSAATTFFWSNVLLTIVPLIAVTYVLLRFFGKTFSHIPFSNIAIGTSFVIIWGLSLWMLNKEFNMKGYEIRFMTLGRESREITTMISTDEPLEAEQAVTVVDTDGKGGEGTLQLVADGEPAPEDAITATVLGSQKKGYEIRLMTPSEEPEEITTTIRTDEPLDENQQISVFDMESTRGKGKLKIIDPARVGEFASAITATVLREKQNETEVPASWFGILNSFFIITFAPLFDRLWRSKLNPSASGKFGLGLILLGLGFGALAWASRGIEQGASTASVSLWWLVIAYLMHTLGELCVSPVGLSYVSKLAPAKLVGLMFGFWFLCTAIANWLAGKSGSFIDKISEDYGLTTFFLIFTVIPICAGLLMWILKGWIRKKMHGIS